MKEAATGSGVVKYPSGNLEDIGPQGGKPRVQWEMCMGRSLQDRWGRRENRGNTRHVISNKTQTLAHTRHTCIPSHTTWRPKAATYCDNMYLKIQKCLLPNVMITFKQINLLCTKIQHKFQVLKKNMKNEILFFLSNLTCIRTLLKILFLHVSKIPLWLLPPYPPVHGTSSGKTCKQC